MGLIQLIKECAETWRIERDKRRKQKEQYRIEYAFTSGGRKYYCYEDITNLPLQRGRAALACFNEIEMRCSREFLVRFTEAMDEVLQSNRIDIYRINMLNGLLKDRLSLTADLELCYRLAAIVYFDETENPAVYEPEYGAKKIERWRKDMKVSDFFMQKLSIPSVTCNHSVLVTGVNEFFKFSISCLAVSQTTLSLMSSYP